MSPNSGIELTNESAKILKITAKVNGSERTLKILI